MERDVKIKLFAQNRMGRGIRSAIRSIESVREAGARMLRQLAIPAAGAAAAVMLVGASFEQSMAQLSAVTSAPAAELQMLEGRARQLGATTAFAARESVDAMNVLALTGQDTAEIYQTVEGVMILAGAAQFDMARTAELVTSSQKQFGLATGRTNDIVNLFAAGMARSNLNMERLSAAMPYAGVAAGTFNVPIEETVALLGLLHNRGLLGEMAGTALRQTFIQLHTPSGDLAKKLGDVTLRTHSVTEVLDELARKGVVAADAYELVGARAGGALQVMLESGTADIRAFTQELDELAGKGEAFTQYEKQMDTVQSRFKILRSAAEEAGLAIFDVFRDDIVRGLTRLTETILSITPRVVTVLSRLWALFKELDAAIWTAMRSVEAFIGTNKDVILMSTATIAALMGISAVWKILSNRAFLTAAAVFALYKGLKELAQLIPAEVVSQMPEQLQAVFAGAKKLDGMLDSVLAKIEAFFGGAEGRSGEPLALGFDPEALANQIAASMSAAERAYEDGVGAKRASFGERSADVIVETNRSAWRTVIDMDISGTERREKIWESFLGSLVDQVGTWTSELIVQDLLRLGSHTATEKAMTAVTMSEFQKRRALTLGTSVLGPLGGLFGGLSSVLPVSPDFMTAPMFRGAPLQPQGASAGSSNVSVNFTGTVIGGRRGLEEVSRQVIDQIQSGLSGEVAPAGAGLRA